MTSRRECIQIQHSGRTYNGAYRVDGGLVCVESAYGSRAADVGRSDPERVAKRLMLELVKGWSLKFVRTSQGAEQREPPRT